MVIISSMEGYLKLDIVVTLNNHRTTHHNNPFPTTKLRCVILSVMSTDMVLLYIYIVLDIFFKPITWYTFCKAVNIRKVGHYTFIR